MLYSTDRIRNHFLIAGICLLLNLAALSQTLPSVHFTSVPAWGTTNLLLGAVRNTSISDQGIAVYIFVEEAGGWWNKPFTAQPVTPIQSDSTFSTNIVIGGLDEYATKIAAFLVPASFSPPILSGGDLPLSMFSYPYATTCRPHGDRVISWSGFDWTVKRSVGGTLLPIGPGPNIFNGSDSMVWVDDQQRMHLRIAKKGAKWHCTELIGVGSQGYRRYNFAVGSQVDLFDPNVIAGIFTWDDCAPYAQPPDNFFREIDFEFSRWGVPGNYNSQFVIQPYNASGNINRFDMNLDGTDHSDHYFEWTPDSIAFKSTWGDASHAWTYRNPGHVPIPGAENLRINLHLFNASPPTDQKDAELILNSFVTGVPGSVNSSETIKAYPNPFVEKCTFGIYADHAGKTEIAIFDLHGNQLRNLVSVNLTPGSNPIEWDGKTSNGQTLQPGMYIVRITHPSGINYLKILKN